MAKPIGARCNLACRYCYYLEKEALLYPRGAGTRMTDEMLERFVRDYIGAQPAEGTIDFAWQGGEPTLLGLDFFRRAVALQRHYACGRPVANALQTNGTLLDDAWGEFFARENFLVGISIDGSRAAHDANRVDRGQRPTWENVRRGVRVLRRHGVAFNTLTVVNRRNCREPVEIYDLLVGLGARHLQFIPLVERKPAADEAARGLAHASPATGSHEFVSAENLAASVSSQSVPSGRFGAFLCAIFDHWVRRDVGRVFVQQFDSALNSWVGLGPTSCVFQERCGRALALEHNGDVFACDHYVYPAFKLGNLAQTSLADLVNGQAAVRFGAAKADLPSRCRKCAVRFACNGDCPKHRFLRAGSGEPGVSYLCDDYRHFFSHIDPAMRFMANLLRLGRAPAEIMRSGMNFS
jgi:uncharacterized protein